MLLEPRMPPHVLGISLINVIFCNHGLVCSASVNACKNFCLHMQCLLTINSIYSLDLLYTATPTSSSDVSDRIEDYNNDDSKQYLIIELFVANYCVKPNCNTYRVTVTMGSDTSHASMPILFYLTA